MIPRESRQSTRIKGGLFLQKNLRQFASFAGLFLILSGCAAPQTGDTIRRSVQARVVYELRTAPNRNAPSIESYLEHAALSIRQTAAGDNLTPDYVKNQVAKSEARQHWSIQAELTLDDALRFYDRAYRRASPSNRANLLAVADGINLARQTR